MNNKKEMALFVKVLCLAIAAAIMASFTVWVGLIAVASPSEVKMVICFAIILIILYIISRSLEIINFVREIFNEIEKEVEEL